MRTHVNRNSCYSIFSPPVLQLPDCLDCMDFMEWNSYVYGLSLQLDCKLWIAWIAWISWNGTRLFTSVQLDCNLWIASFAWMAWIVWMGNPVRISSLHLDCNYFQLNKSLVVWLFFDTGNKNFWINIDQLGESVHVHVWMLIECLCQQILVRASLSNGTQNCVLITLCKLHCD